MYTCLCILIYFEATTIEKASSFRMSSKSIFRLLVSTSSRIHSIWLKDQFKNYKNLKLINYFIFKNLNLIKSVNLLSFAIVMAANQDLVKQVDELYDQNKFDEIENLLNKEELLEKSDNRFEFKWRLARSRYGQVKEKQRGENELDEIRDLVLSALEDNPKCGPAHKVIIIKIDNY